MGFLKFLKRDKSKEPDLGLEEMEDLDMPPPPPDFEGKGLETPEKELPELPELPEMPETEEPFPEIGKKLVPELEVPTEKPSPELKPPSMPEFPKMEEGLEEPEFPQPRRPLFGVQKPRPIASEQKLPVQPKIEVPPPKGVPEIKPYERMERAAVREERTVLRHKEAKEPIFIRVDRFRDILTGTGTIRNNLKIAEQSIVKLNDIDANRDKVLEKWSNVMIDLQKKLIFIDKILFKR